MLASISSAKVNAGLIHSFRICCVWFLYCKESKQKLSAIQEASRLFSTRLVLLNGATIERTACVDKVNRVGQRCWKRSSVALLAAAITMAWAFIGFRGMRNFEAVCWVASTTSVAARKLRKFVEKIQTMVNERPINGAKKCNGENQKISTHLFPGETFLEGAWTCPKSLSTPSKTHQWMKMLANNIKSSATTVDLRAVLRRWGNLYIYIYSTHST